MAAVLAAIEAGSTRRAAAALSGVPLSTFYRFMEGTSFADAVSRAEGTFERNMITRIVGAAAHGSWQAAAWLLERRLPNDWRQRTELDVNVTTPQEASIVRFATSLVGKTLAELDAEQTELDTILGRHGP